MNLDGDERIGGPIAPPKKRGWLALIGVSFMACLAGAAGVFLLSTSAREAAEQWMYAGLETTGFVAPNKYSPVFERFKIAPFPARYLAQPKVNDALTKLEQEPCDKNAIYSLGEAMVQAGAVRLAANAYLGFEQNCPNGDGEKARAAQLFHHLGDYAKTTAIAAELIEKYPANSNYRYLRAQALAGEKKFAEALPDYARTIDLQDNPRNVGEWVFFDMARAFAALDRFCEAQASVLYWVSLDPETRITAKAKALIEHYARPDSSQCGARNLDLKSL